MPACVGRAQSKRYVDTTHVWGGGSAGRWRLRRVSGTRLVVWQWRGVTVIERQATNGNLDDVVAEALFDLFRRTHFSTPKAPADGLYRVLNQALIAARRSGEKQWLTIEKLLALQPKPSNDEEARCAST